MPLGFARSVLTQAAAAAASTDRGFWKQATAVSVGGSNANTAYAQFTKTSAVTSNTRNILISCWFQVTASDFDTGDNDLFVLVSNFQGNNSRWGVDFEKAAGITFFYADNNGVNSISTGNLSNTFQSTYVDGDWHHFWGQIRPGSTADNKIYLDGVDKTTNTSAMTGNSITADTVYTVGNRDDNLGSIETTAKFANCYVLHGDSTNYISNISYWYNSGYVDLGTDGTASGAPAPTFYITVSGGNLNLGAGAGTLTTGGSSTLTKSNTGGPQ